jgi:hypothetical protein
VKGTDWDLQRQSLLASDNQVVDKLTSKSHQGRGRSSILRSPASSGRRNKFPKGHQ